MPIRPENRARYPKDWAEISVAVREAALWRCQCEGECGRGHAGRCIMRQGDQGPSGWPVVLTVAHLDHTPENCHPDNLKAMCQGCHLHYDKDHHAETRRVTRARELAAAGIEPLPGLELP
jgi:hypothetical protein